jgi:Protein of unknown function (DUF3096)
MVDGRLARYAPSGSLDSADRRSQLLETALTLAQRGTNVNIDFTLSGAVALIAGILILVFPSLLARLVAAYLIVIGLIQVFDLRI